MSSKVRSDLASLVLWRVSRVEKAGRVTTANKDGELSVDCGSARLLGGGFDVPPGVAVLRSSISRDAKTWIWVAELGLKAPTSPRTQPACNRKTAMVHRAC